MATPTKIVLCILAAIASNFVIYKLIVITISNDYLRARALRFQLSIVILSFMSLFNCFVWRNLSCLFDNVSERTKLSDDAPASIEEWSLFIDFSDIQNWRSYTVKSLSWRVLLGTVQISSLFAYTSYSFLIRTEPIAISFWLFLCFATVIQLFSGLVFMKLLQFIVRYVLKKRSKLKNSKIQGIIVVIYAVTIVSVGFNNTLKSPTIKEVTIPIKGLSRDMNNFEITFVSDIHLGPTVGLKHLEIIVNMINYLQSGLLPYKIIYKLNTTFSNHQMKNTPIIA